MQFSQFLQAIHRVFLGFRQKKGYLILVFLLLQCCTYLNREPGRPPKIAGEPIRSSLRYLYVQNFRNNSYGPAVHSILGRFVKEEVDRRGRFIQTRDRGKASYRLYGEIVHYQRVGSLMDNANQQISSEIFVIVKVDLIGKDGYKLILPRNEIPARAYYSSQIGYRETEEQAQSRMLRNLAIRLVEEVEEAWYKEMLRKHRLSQK
ncbi:MAG: LPS assembly lipoprotein LptE [Spirochaetota bacterium]